MKPMAEDSLELVQRLVNGDQAAVGPLLERHLPGLRAWVRVQSGGTLNALESNSDLCQSVCREVLEKVDRFQYEGEGAFRHWLYTTATRKIRNKQKFYLAQRRDVGRKVPIQKQSPSGEYESLVACYASISTPSEVAVAREEVEKIESALLLLSEEHREVILLARMLELSHAEIAERMGRNESGIRVLLFRALASLADKMG